MNDQSQMQQMNHVQVQPQMMMPSNPQLLNPVPPMMINSTQTHIRNQQVMNQQPPPMMINRTYMPWPQPQPQPQPHERTMNFLNHMRPNLIPSKPRSNWKGKKGGLAADNRKDQRIASKMGGGGYKPPTLNELQSQNRLKARKFYPKKKFNNRFAPYAPRNTTSFIIRAKKAGGIAELVSPCAVTPAVLPTPMFSPSREILGDMAKEEWGVDGYGSMKGLIRLRSSPGNEDDEEEEGGGSSESDVEEHVEVERRLDHDLSRFEMIYPNYGGVEYHNVLENRVDDQDSHITQLEEENLTLKERLFLMEREMGELRRRLSVLERSGNVREDVTEEVVENFSDNESGGGSDVGDNNEGFTCTAVVDKEQEEELQKGVKSVCTLEEEGEDDHDHELVGGDVNVKESDVMDDTARGDEDISVNEEQKVASNP